MVHIGSDALCSNFGFCFRPKFMVLVELLWFYREEESSMAGWVGGRNVWLYWRNGSLMEMEYSAGFLGIMNHLIRYQFTGLLEWGTYFLRIFWDLLPLPYIVSYKWLSIRIVVIDLVTDSKPCNLTWSRKLLEAGTLREPSLKLCLV